MTVLSVFLSINQVLNSTFRQCECEYVQVFVYAYNKHHRIDKGKEKVLLST